MELKEKIEQPLLSRTWVNGEVSFEGPTPSNDKLSKDIASAMKSDISLVVMKSIRTVFGLRKASFSAAVYKDAAALAHAEVKTKRQRDAQAKSLAEAKKAADEAQAANKEKSGEVA